MHTFTILINFEIILNNNIIYPYTLVYSLRIYKKQFRFIIIYIYYNNNIYILYHTMRLSLDKRIILLIIVPAKNYFWSSLSSDNSRSCASRDILFLFPG